MSNLKNQLGYNIVEMMIALVVLGVFLGGALVPLQKRFQTQQIENAIEHLQSAKEAVIAYSLQNRTIRRQLTYYDGAGHIIPAGRPYLPCPDIDFDGLEDRSALLPSLQQVSTARLAVAGACTQQKGLLPWKTLGMNQEVDVWGTQLTYAVDLSFSNELLGFDETFYADEFDRRLSLRNVGGEFLLARRSNENDYGLIVCTPSDLVASPNRGCPENDFINVLAGVLTDEDVVINGRSIESFDSAASPYHLGLIEGASFVILSHGKNGFGGVNAEGACRAVNPLPNVADGQVNERINSFYRSGHPLVDCSGITNVFENIFISSPPVFLDGDDLSSDDILVWGGKNELLGVLLQGGVLPIEKLGFLPSDE